MKVLLERAQTFATVEQTLGDLEHSTDSDDNEVVLPRQLRGRTLGAEVALVQLLIAAHRRKSGLASLLYIRDPHHASDHLHRLTRTLFGAAALGLSSATRLGSGVDVSELAARELDARLIELQTDIIANQRGNRALVPCFDHTPHWRLPAVYYADGSVRRRDEFVLLTRRLLARASSARQEQGIHDIVQNSLGVILHELFKNTHDWARMSLTGTPLITLRNRSLRSIVIERHSLPRSEMMQAVTASPQLAEYVTRTSSEPRARYIELSVVDSGPGLASRWVGRDANSLTIQDEANACMSCLAKHASTSKSVGRGFGLYEVVSTLTALGGFLRLRSGRLCLWRDFALEPTREGERPLLHDWGTGTQEPTLYAHAPGAAFTMLVPLEGHGRA